MAHAKRASCRLAAVRIADIEQHFDFHMPMSKEDLSTRQVLPCIIDKLTQWTMRGLPKMMCRKLLDDYVKEQVRIFPMPAPIQLHPPRRMYSHITSSTFSIFYFFSFIYTLQVL